MFLKVENYFKFLFLFKYSLFVYSVDYFFLKLLFGVSDCFVNNSLYIKMFIIRFWGY